ncbi:peptidase of plants and bacteria-domain-containing protein [Mycena amicta]|nr:peptidase of plants and bacteria-domain-containing protein [Mycena amicta]
MPPPPAPEPEPEPEPTWPLPKFSLRVEDLAHPGAALFFSALSNPTQDKHQQHSSDGPLEALRYAVISVFEWLYAVPECAPTNVKEILLVLRPMDGVAYTFGSHHEKEIHFSLNHIENSKARAREEILGVLVHEVVHCYQHNANGTAPGGFIEGVADYVRLHATLAPPHWRRAAPSRDDHWDAGYERTAFFLDWLESTSPTGEGTVRKMNAALHGQGVTWQNARVFETFSGAKVGALWRRYRVELGGELVEESDEPESEQSAEPEKVDETAVCVIFVIPSLSFR